MGISNKRINKVELIKEFSLQRMDYVFCIYINNVVRRLFFDENEAKKYFESFKNYHENIDKKEILETYEY